MKQTRSNGRFGRAGNAALLIAVISIAACGGDGNSSGNEASNPTPTSTPTATATRPPSTAAPTATAIASHPPATVSATPTVTATPTGGSGSQVSGLLAVRNDVVARASDALGALPPDAQTMIGKEFDRSLAHADWSVRDTTLSGETGADGRFVIGGLAAGHYVMDVSKTVDGNLMSFAVTFTAGDAGAEVIAEVAWGLVRTTSTYTDGGVAVREVTAPNGSRLVVRDGQVVEFGDSRVFRDPDGDGRFETDSCPGPGSAWLCDGDRSCSDSRVCSCTASCPTCEDCGKPVCVEPRVCPEGSTCPSAAYACSPQGGCELPGDKCVCVSSCPECDDCAFGVCVPGQTECPPVEITALYVNGTEQLVVGQQGSLQALAQLSDGTAVDVTWLVDWSSSNPAVASIDSWGAVQALTAGTAEATATLGDVTSDPWTLRIIERPALQRIQLRNANCYYPLGAPREDTPGGIPSAPPPTGDLPPPSCGQVIRVGATLNLVAYGEFDGGYYQDITDEVTWTVDPAAVGSVEGGLFTALEEGTADVTATLDGVASNPVQIEVVTHPTLIALSIYPQNWSYRAVAGGPVAVDAALPCFDCGYSFTVLRGDHAQFQATAHYDTGEWEDVTQRVAWSSSNPAAATIDASGSMTAVGAGDANIEARLDETASGPVAVHVADHATLQYVYVYEEGTDRVVGKGDQLYFKATGSYDVGFERDITTEVTWVSSDTSVGGFDTPGVFTGRGAGVTHVSAELDGIEANGGLDIEVFETSALDYCDGANVNRGVWSDDFNRVILESDCAEYTEPAVVAIRYTVTETQPHGGIFDPCLDLYVLKDGKPVRTLREEGCGDPFLPAGAPARDEEAVKYQLRAFWDLKDDSGGAVAPGTYTVFGRFYLYYDPIVSIDVAVRAPQPN